MRMTSKPLSRRRLIAGFVSTAALTWTAGIAKPYLSRATDRPLITHGLQSGDIGVDSGVVWARSDRPARMQIEIATTDSFRDIRGGAFVDALPDSDFTAKLLLKELPASQDIFYRIRFQDLASPTIVGEPMVGRFRTAPSDRRSISFCWSGDQAGQGWGIDESRGGMRTYATMLRNRPDFFIHSGDHIYADLVLPPEVKLANGEVWRNLVTEEKTHVAETSTTTAATGNTICSTRTCSRSMPRSRPSRNGTTTRCSTIGGRASRSPAPSIGAGTITRRPRCSSARAPTAPCANICR